GRLLDQRIVLGLRRLESADGGFPRRIEHGGERRIEIGRPGGQAARQKDNESRRREMSGRHARAPEKRSSALPSSDAFVILSPAARRNKRIDVRFRDGEARTEPLSPFAVPAAARQEPLLTPALPLPQGTSRRWPQSG